MKSLSSVERENLGYAEFLRAKAQLATTAGFLDVSVDDVNPILKPHQRDAVVWAVRARTPDQ